MSIQKHLIKSHDVKLKFNQAISKMLIHFESFEKAQGLREIMHHESSVAKIYYPTLTLAIKPELGFTTRNNLRNSRLNNASNVINDLLNYGLGILYVEVTKQLNALGLDSFYGFYPKNHESH